MRRVPRRLLGLVFATGLVLAAGGGGESQTESGALDGGAVGPLIWSPNGTSLALIAVSGPLTVDDDRPAWRP